MDVGVVVVAAGSGQRFGGAKQRAPILGRPAYLWALSALLSVPQVARACLVVPPGEEQGYRREVEEEGLGGRTLVQAGGDSRTASVRLGLEALCREGEPTFVLVHDGARPLVAQDVVDRLLQVLADGHVDGVVPVLEVTDTLRWRQRPGGPAREEVVRVQTPQAFRTSLLRQAHRWAWERGARFGDDAGLVEAIGGRIAHVAGDPRGEKITRRHDLAWVRLWAGDLGVRLGMGLDHHRFAPGRRLMLCGVPIPEAPEGLGGHSDADVALHAVANALLAAVGERDIGVHFPPGEERTRGMASSALVAFALERVREKGYAVHQVQVVLTAPRPPLAAYVPAMQKGLASLLAVQPCNAVVHVTSGEGTLADAIEAHAMVTLRWA